MIPPISGSDYDAAKSSVTAQDVDGDVYRRALNAMARCQVEDLETIPYATLDEALGLVSSALHVLSSYWPALTAVRAAVDLTRTVSSTKENVRKRIAGLRLMQADLLCCLFSLRDFVDDHQRFEGKTFPERLQCLCDGMSADINWLGNMIEKYKSEGFLGRLLKEVGWKEQVEKCSQIVNNRKKEFRLVIETIAAVQIHHVGVAVNQSLESDQKLLHLITDLAIDVKALVGLFDPISEEQKVLDEVKLHGGLEKCLRDPAALQALAHHIPNERGPKSTSDDSKPQLLTIAELRRIQLPVEELLTKNLTRFEQKIDLLLQKVVHEHHHMRSAISRLDGARPWTRIEDPDIRKLWKDMSWGGSVDAHTFVLNLYDYFIDLEHESHPKKRLMPPETPSPTPTALSPIIVHISSVPSTAPSEADDHDEPEGGTTPEAAAKDAWCLKYFNYRTLSMFVEVLDSDLNGLIKIKEVNVFTRTKPEGITLMQWIVYCAYGWLVSAHLYRLRLEWIITHIVCEWSEYAKENSEIVATYGELLHWIRAFLHSLEEPDLDDAQLLKVSRTIMQSQERTVEGTLKQLNYELEEGDIRTMMALDMRGGPHMIGRVEERILPVLFLVLQRHYAILSLAKRYILQENALEGATRTIDCLTDLLIVRAKHLREHFSRSQCDVDRKMKYCANGMFQDMHRFLSESRKEGQSDILNQWCLPWKSLPKFSIYRRLREYDPDFQLDLSTHSGPPLPLRDLVRTVSSPGEVDAGYELVASYRERYGIRIARFASIMTQDERGKAKEATMPEEPAVIEPQYHRGIECDGCSTIPISGPRFKCIDCPDFDYCSSCYAKFPPPTSKFRLRAAVEHAASHRFLIVELPVPTAHLNAVLSLLNPATGPRRLGKLDSLIEHCLSAPGEEVQQIAKALYMFRTQYLEGAGIEADSGPDSGNTRFAPLPLAAEYAQSRGDHLLNLRRECSLSKPLHPGYQCDGQACTSAQRRIMGHRYKCIDCPDIDFCSQCFNVSWSKHHDGNHRFVLLQHASARIVVQSLLLALSRTYFNGEDDMFWTSQEPRHAEDDANTTSSTASSVRAEDEGSSSDTSSPGASLECYLCKQTLRSGEIMYKCLNCTLLSGGVDNLLCSACALSTVSRGAHQPAHILAVILTKVASPLADGGAEKNRRSSEGNAVQLANSPANEEFSKRMDKLEETMAMLLSMVAKLQVTDLTVVEAGVD